MPEKLDALPIINYFIDKLELDDILKCAMPHADPSNHIMPHISIGIVLRNIIAGRLALYNFKDWVDPFAPQLFHLNSEQVDYINDDRVGRAL
ncbi:DUF4277 domain-containing protein [Methanoplanus endosymbiosus]|nr:DUF4277 domain-containing protein [Methanoplanus endosymbiosus]UUX91892.1 DUF4277 domain-containing protein [Methanoplanus endosymbiosus]